MKTNTVIKLIVLVITGSIMFSCVNDDDFNVPKNLGGQENKALQQLLDSIYKPDNGYNLVSIQNVKDRFANNKYAPLKIETNDVVKGYVTSSDATGNFYREIFIQDSIANPTAGLKIAVNASDTYNKFNIGREVYIHLKDLYIGETRSGDKVVAVGGKINDKEGVDILSTKQIEDFVLRSQLIKTLEPLEVKFSEINKSHVGMYVKVDKAEFVEDIVGETYVDPYDDYDSKRDMQSCEGDKYANFILETSTFASFRNKKLPEGGGSISGIINYDYNGKNLVMVLNTSEDVKFTNDRCELTTYEPVFFDDFSSKNFNNWTVQDIKGSQKWYYNKYGNPEGSATMSGYDSSASTSRENEDWLITKAIDLSAIEKGAKVFLKFDNDIKYTGPKMEVYMATDYKGGNPNTDGTWTTLSANWDPNTDDFNTWVSSGDIDVSTAVGGNLFIAFKYTSTNSKSATYEIDNVSVVVGK